MILGEEKDNMYYPHYQTSNSNFPILSKRDISVIAERYAREFMPEIVEDPQPFNVDGFAENYLGLQLDYQYLSNDARYLGMMVFNDTDRVIVYLPDADQAEYMHADQGTVIIDCSLLAKKQEHRYRFTMGHECGHWVFHRSYYGYDASQLNLFDTQLPYIKCRESLEYDCYGFTNKWEDSKWMEWHADHFSAGLLMPETAVHLLLNRELSGNSSEQRKITLVSERFNVSEKAAFLRLQELGLIQQPGK